MRREVRQVVQEAVEPLATKKALEEAISKTATKKQVQQLSKEVKTVTRFFDKEIAEIKRN